MMSTFIFVILDFAMPMCMNESAKNKHINRIDMAKAIAEGILVVR